MPQYVDCTCGKRDRVDDAYRGHLIRCRHCGHEIRVPQADSPAARQAPATQGGRVVADEGEHDPDVSLREQLGHWLARGRRWLDWYLGQLVIDWQPAPPHLRRCIDCFHHQVTTHAPCEQCGGTTVGTDLARVYTGADTRLQKSTQAVDGARRGLNRSGIITAAIAAALALIALWRSLLALFIVPVIAAVAALVQLGAAQVVRWKLYHEHGPVLREARIDPTDANPAAGAAAAAAPIHVLPFFKRNELPVEIAASESAPSVPSAPTAASRQGATMTLKRMLPDGTGRIVALSAEELSLLEALLADRGAPLPEGAGLKRAYLNACALKGDVEAFREQLRHLERSGQETMEAFTTLTGGKAELQPWLRAILAEREEPIEPEKLQEAIDAELKKWKLRNFELDLERRRRGEAINITIEMIDRMDPYRFEHLVGMLYAALGYQVEETPRGSDQGADVFISKGGERMVIQAKLYSQPVGNKAVQEAIAARSHFGCARCAVVTNNTFTPAARELAATSDVDLVDRAQLTGMLERFNKAPKDYARLGRLFEASAPDAGRGGAEGVPPGQ